MCFHISLTKSAKDIEKKSKMFFNIPFSFEPYYHFNGWETKHLAIIKQGTSATIDLSLWGLLPTNYDLSKRKDFLIKTNTLNATKERLYDSNLFSQFIRKQRCLILADGLFEPHSALGIKNKIPYYFKEKNHDLIAFAGVYSVIDDNESTPIYSASIITTEANNMFKEIHNTPNKLGSYRMPLILDPSDYYDWLNVTDDETIKILLHTFTKQEIINYPVSTSLFSNKINTNVPSILDKVAYQQSLF
ncbi:SOS response-associated peptidase [Polaribacter sargassicola]|uniref:SOS response-associated peptidase n=1 Tax=Polaribacter sargassicola TaxID=2836891 RepID=UPI0021D48197|nr:SOS response-associated peptidase [Polaribacter sp. DS7-9]MCG1037291.1 SOS response-associated peptidase family protein [Polaribacter sp. DS7-9]